MPLLLAGGTAMTRALVALDRHFTGTRRDEGGAANKGYIRRVCVELRKAVFKHFV